MTAAPVWVALLRAVNVGGTGKLAMSDLRAICTGCGFAGVRTYIASGNVVFAAAATETEIKSALEAALERHAGKPVGVIVRPAAELADVLAASPFAGAPGNRAFALFLDAAPASGALDTVTGRTDEETALGRREIYVYYPAGAGTSKLRIPAAAAGTARNLNTVAALVALAGSAA